MARLSWLNTRKRLLVAVFIDFSLFLLLNLFWYQLSFVAWPIFSYATVLLLGFWLLFSYLFGRYYDLEDPRADAAIKQLTRTLLTLFFGIWVYLLYNWILAITPYVENSRSQFFLFLLSLGACSGVAQLALNRALQARFKTSLRWIFIGTDVQLDQLQQASDCGRLKGKLELWPFEQHHHGNNKLFFDASVEHQDFAGVVVTDFHSVSADLLKLLLRWQSEGVPILSTIGWCDHVLQRYPSNLVSSEDLLRGEFVSPQGSIQLRLKRLGDVVVSASLLLLCLPLLLLAGLGIWWLDRGPAFYCQIRNGLAGEPFTVWKLRSMRVNAEEAGAQWSSRYDPRITSVGRLLRLTRLDELPQLWAVLQGKMSLIGPRPERPMIEEKLERFIPHYRLRHLIRPGLSGWAQVNYPYGASLEDSSNKFSYDLYYLRNYSIWLDLLIVVKTIRLVFNAKGALAQG